MSTSEKHAVSSPRSLEEVEIRDVTNNISVAHSAQGNTTDQPSSSASDVACETELDQLSSSYLRHNIQSHGLAKSEGNDSESRLLWTSLPAHSKDDEGRNRVMVADIRCDGKPMLAECQESRQLAELLDKDGDGTNATRIVVVENLSLTNMCIIGSRFKIHPSVFARHFIHLRFSCLHSDNMTSFLASSPLLSNPSPVIAVGPEPRCFTLGFFDIVPKDPDSYTNTSPFQSWLKRQKEFPNTDFAAFNILRRVFIPPKTGDWDVDGEVVTVQSKITVWKDPSSRKTVVLVDPTIRDPRFARLIDGTTAPDTTESRIRFANSPLRSLGAPLDLEESSTMSISSNLFDDIKNILGSSREHNSDLERVLGFLRSYVMDKWIGYLNHVHRCLVSARDKQSIRSMQPGGGWSEDMFISLKYWSEFLPMVQLIVEANMRALGIDIFDESSFGVGGAREAKMWRYIHRMLGNYAKMFERVADSYTQVVAIKEAQSSTIQAHASATQAQFVGRLTMLGTLFLPASLVAGILSMGGDFLPGQRLFWVYIVVLVPVLLIVVLVLFTDLGTIFIPDAVSLNATKSKRSFLDSKRGEKGSDDR